MFIPKSDETKISNDFLFNISQGYLFVSQLDILNLRLLKDTHR